VSATYPENLRAEVERYLRAMRFSHEPLTVGLEEEFAKLSEGTQEQIAVLTRLGFAEPHRLELPEDRQLHRLVRERWHIRWS